MLYLPIRLAADLEELERDPDVAGRWFADSDDVVDLGEAWHAIHFLLTGSAWGGSSPLRDAVLGGTALGDPTSYEPVRFVSAAELEALAEALPTPEELVPRFTHKALKQAEVYPESAWEQGDALTAFVLPAYVRLVELVTDTAAAGRPLLITLQRD